VLVGDGPARPDLESRARALGLGDSVVFAGLRRDARDLTAGFDVYANVSTSEGVSLTVLEAMAEGLAVVATRVGGTPEVVEDGLSGVLVPTRSPEATASAIGALISEPARRHELGRRARVRVVEHFSLDRMVAEYGALYDDALRRQ
jgi:glycosyltransferase involved in cell wall biosynthesis